MRKISYENQRRIRNYFTVVLAIKCQTLLQKACTLILIDSLPNQINKIKFWY